MIQEQLRLLLNFQLADRFLAFLLLAGQPELRKNIETNKQLAQRIAIRSHLDRFNKEDTAKYIMHRLKVAGLSPERTLVGRPETLLSETALHLIYEGSGGIPRRINHIVNMALLAAYGKNLTTIDADIIQDAVKEMGGAEV